MAVHRRDDDLSPSDVQLMLDRQTRVLELIARAAPCRRCSPRSSPRWRS
ncbi:MAG: hypothetical protein R2731_08545 [Nocardioides sp.]